SAGTRINHNQTQAPTEMNCQLEALDALLMEGERLLGSQTVDNPARTTRNVIVGMHNTRGIANCRNYRLNKKAQRDELRRQEVELRLKLSRLRQLKRAKKAKEDATRSSCYLLWRDLATRLRVERNDTEVQQQQLRFVVNNQAMYINAMREILAERVNSSMVFFDTELAVPFNWYIQELEARLLQMDEVFHTNKLVHKRESGVAAEAFYPRSRLVLPSSVSETSNIFWQIGQQLFSDRQDYVHYQDANYPDNTIIASFVDTDKQETGETGSRLQRFISRRFVQDTQLSFCWKLIADGDGFYRGAKTDETGWCRFFPSEDANEPGTVVEICVRRVSVPFSGPAPESSVVNAFHKVLHEDSKGVLMHIVTTMENTLLDKALTNISRLPA
ncbi:hypothetical protein F442_22286, partial [Phytophthora nicotianae P10297]